MFRGKGGGCSDKGRVPVENGGAGLINEREKEVIITKTEFCFLGQSPLSSAWIQGRFVFLEDRVAVCPFICPPAVVYVAKHSRKGSSGSQVAHWTGGSLLDHSPPHQIR